MRILHLIDSGGRLRSGTHSTVSRARAAAARARAIDRQHQRPGYRRRRAFEALAASAGDCRGADPHRSPPDAGGRARTCWQRCARCRRDVLHSHGYKANILLGSLPRARARGPMLDDPARLDRAAGVSARSGSTSASTAGRCGGSTPWSWWRAACSRCRRCARSRPADVHLIENGIPPASPARAICQASIQPHCRGTLLDFMRRQPTLLAIGRLSAEKGFALLLEAFARAGAAASAWAPAAHRRGGPGARRARARGSPPLACRTPCSSAATWRAPIGCSAAAAGLRHELASPRACRWYFSRRCSGTVPILATSCRRDPRAARRGAGGPAGPAG